MKKYCTITIVLIIFTFTSLTVFASNTEFSDFDDFVNSAEYTEISMMEKDILNQFRELYVAEYSIVPGDFPESLDFSKISKVYVDTNIEDINTSDKAAIEGLLNQSTYIWVIPIECGGKHFSITLAKGLPLDEDRATALTDEEKLQVQANTGKWIITEVAERPVESYPDTLSDEIGDNTAIDDTVLIGGIPGIRMPIALGFKEDQATAWIEIGFEYPVMDNIPSTLSAENYTYDYNTVLERLQDYKEPTGVVTGGATGELSSLKKDNSSRFYIACGSVVLIFSVVAFYLRKRNTK